MTILEAIDARHSVRAYLDRPIPPDVCAALDAFTLECNRASGLHIFIRYDDPRGFDSRLAHYGSFRDVSNYIVLAGRKIPDFDFACGYWGEKIVLRAQQLGLNTCWTAMTFNKKTVRALIPEGEEMCMVIALGYGASQGTPHRGRSFTEVTENAPDESWFAAGVDAALKAPTAVNQQRFLFTMRDGEPFVRARGIGPYLQVDQGIAACHFEAASGRAVRH